MDGWINPSQDGDGWLAGWLAGWLDGWMDGLIQARMDGWMDGFIQARMDGLMDQSNPRFVSYTHLRAHETEADLECRTLLEKKKQN